MKALSAMASRCVSLDALVAIATSVVVVGDEVHNNEAEEHEQHAERVHQQPLLVLLAVSVTKTQPEL